MKSYLERLFKYMTWADQRTIESLRASPSAHGEALPLLAHLLAAEHIWLERLNGRTPRHPVWPTLTIEECAALAAENSAGYRAYLENMDEDQFSAQVSYRNSQGQSFQTSVLDILTQVITHGPYHRGQIAKAIGRCGGTAVNTDFITVAREEAGI